MNLEIGKKYLSRDSTIVSYVQISCCRQGRYGGDCYDIDGNMLLTIEPEDGWLRGGRIDLWKEAGKDLIRCLEPLPKDWVEQQMKQVREQLKKTTWTGSK